MTVYIAIDDTDSPESRGTGRVAREIARVLSEKWSVFGITRHQLYVHPDILYTSHNSCAVIHVNGCGKEAENALFSIAEEIMLSDFIEGSDPGLCVAERSQVTPALIAYGRDAQTQVLDQERARTLAKNGKIRLKGLGGTEDGVIGALAGIALAARGDDGRYISVGRIRSLTGPVTVEEVLRAGVDCVQTVDGVILREGTIMEAEGKSVKPCPLDRKVVLFVKVENGVIIPVKRG
ncbi:MAG: ABC transporter substrate-binding protein [Methanomicrobiales archaeon]|jgi:tRNA(Ile2) C34 agmatinyltransferase TiaS|nr:ABC transporter substrate-binding protein [Methanomicrobiales archaeon]